MKEYLYNTAKRIGIEISEQQLEQFVLYYDYLQEMNQVMNLTAITDEKEIVLKHFIDSIAFLKYFEVTDQMKIIDVGTGAGFPGIPLAIMCPRIQFTLMDSLKKRIRFLEQIIHICGLHHVECIHSRAEELGKDSNYREQYDFCVSRAVANLSVLLEYCIPFVRIGGSFISYKSVLAEDEMNLSNNAQKELSCHFIKSISFDLPDSDYQRCFLEFQKDFALKRKYPRQNGIPKKKPL